MNESIIEELDMIKIALRDPRTVYNSELKSIVIRILQQNVDRYNK